MKSIKILAMAVVFVMVMMFINQFQSSSQTNATSTLAQTINDKILLCYINEGRYPPSLNYLQENYQLNYDKTKFQVFLIPIAQNIKPDITVFAYE